jgi:hypothetical protein
MQGRDNWTGRALATLALACAAAGAQAAGGHHAVDDAEILPRGECTQETWYSRARSGEHLLHGGVNCRVGPVELGGAGESARAEALTATLWNLEVKWARELADRFSVGLDLQPVWAAHRSPRYAGTRLSALATWKANETLSLHFNAGHTFVRGHGERDLATGGVAAEWSPITRWSFVAERFLDEETHLLRGGARWAAGRQWSLDLSHTHRLSGPVPSFWTLGLTIDLDDD